MIGSLDFRVLAPGNLAFGAVAGDNALTANGGLPVISGGATFVHRAAFLSATGLLPTPVGFSVLRHNRGTRQGLNFYDPAPGRLNFGGEGAIASAVTAAATLSALDGAARFEYRIHLTAAGFFPALFGAARFGVSVRAAGVFPQLAARSYFAVPVYPPRGPACRVLPTWRVSAPVAAEPLCSAWQVAAPSPNRQSSLWNQATPLAARITLPERQPMPQPLAQRSGWDIAAPLAIRLSTQTDLPIQQPLAGRSRWDTATPLAMWGHSGALFPLITPVALVTPWHSATPVAQSWTADWQPGLPQPLVQRSWWGLAMPPAPGIRYRPPPVIPPVRPQGRLDFRCPQPGKLAFGAACFGSAGWLVPIQESYSVLNSGSLTRISDGADIPVSSMTVKIDRDSWCWTLSATLIGRVAADRATEQTEVQATLNGFVWRFVIDSQARDREFGKSDGSISGRSLTAWWSAPYNPTASYLETQAKTAEQLAVQDVPYGGFLDWQLPPWTVPGRVWQYQHLTPVEVLTRIAKACGGMVQADPVDLKFWLSPRWPVKPWEWTTTSPFATLPSAYCTKEERAGIPGAGYDAIIVYGGTDSGIVCMATRAGQPGLVIAPPVNDALLVDIDPAKARAVQEIADLWPMRQFTVTLPLQAQPEGAGLINPGLFFDFSDGLDGWRGLATAVSITASFGKVTQTVTAVSV